MDASRSRVPAPVQPAAYVAAGSATRVRQAELPRLEHALGRLWDELRGLLHDQLLLASLEGRQALACLVRILVLAVTGAALLLGAWAAVTVAVMIWLVNTGLPLALALAIVAGATVALAAALLWLARRSVSDLTFPATLRTLTNPPAGTAQ
jgi:uncharacterized membrane protein YqjE